MYDLEGRQRNHRTRTNIWPTPSFNPSPTQPEKPNSSALKKPSVWRDWIETSTIHGILDFHRPAYGKCWQITWFVVMASFAAAAIYSIEEVISEFISNPTIQNYQEKGATNFPLPDVSICTIQRISDTVLEEMGAPKSLIQGLRSNMDYFDAPSILSQCQQQVDISQEYDAFRAKNNNITFYQLLQQAGFRCEDIVKGCSWSQPCCDKANPFLDATYGKCYRLSMGKKSENSTDMRVPLQTFPGPSAGIRLALSTSYAGSDERNSHTKGIYVEFIYPNEPALFSYYQIPAGVTASIQLSLQVIQRINLIARAQTCEEFATDGPLYDSEGRYNLSSLQKTSSGCFFSMYNLAVQKHCGCANVPNIIGMSLCEPNDPCPFSSPAIDAEGIKLQANCRPPCLRRSYSASVTYSKFNATAYLRGASQCGSKETFDDGIIVLDIYHPQMEYLKVTEVEVYSAMTLISNIGGAVGLWLGTSLMSIVQVIFYFTKWITTRN